MMIEDARAVFLSFPEAEEREHHGHPDYRVGGKIFASIQPAKGLAVLRLPIEMVEALAEGSPGKRFVSRFGGMGWLAVTLEGADLAEFEALAAEAFELRRARR